MARMWDLDDLWTVQEVAENLGFSTAYVSQLTTGEYKDTAGFPQAMLEIPYRQVRLYSKQQVVRWYIARLRKSAESKSAGRTLANKDKLFADYLEQQLNSGGF